MGGEVLRIKAHDNDPFTNVWSGERWDVIPDAESWTLSTCALPARWRYARRRHPNELVVAVVHGGVIAHHRACNGARPFAFNGADGGSIRSHRADG
jgi:hypothetical protein